MQKITPIIEALVAANATPEMILAAVRAAEEQKDAATEATRQKARDRVRRWRERNVTERHETSRNGLREGVTRVEDKPLPLENNNNQENKKRGRAPASLSEFEDWYADYPHKVSRGAAEKAFPKARAIASLAELKAGVRRYIASKPADRAWQNPATWLNGKGWLDQPGTVIPMARGSPRPVDNLINSLLTDMDQADAIATTQIEGYPAPARRLPGF